MAVPFLFAALVRPGVDPVLVRRVRWLDPRVKEDDIAADHPQERFEPDLIPPAV